jgi:1,4-dihydroxy-2-naphthoate octaprenyltransferase
MNVIKKFIVVTRAFSFTVSGSSVILGSISALVFAGVDFNIFHFVLALIGMIVLHAG